MIDWKKPIRLTDGRKAVVLGLDWRKDPNDTPMPVAVLGSYKSGEWWQGPMPFSITGENLTKGGFGSTAKVENIPVTDIEVARKLQADTLIGAMGEWCLLYADGTETPYHDAPILRRLILNGTYDHTRDVQATLAAIRYGREHP